MLRFTSDSNDIEIPLTRLRIELAPLPRKHVVFSDPQRPEWSVFTFDLRVLDCRPLLQQTATGQQIRQFRAAGELKRALVVTSSFVAGFAVLALAASMLMGLMVRSLVSKVPPAWEKKLGDEAMKQLRKQPITFSDDPGLRAKLDKAVAPLVRSLTTNAADFQFHVIKYPRPNAMALPGGYVIVTSDLLDMADRPEDIAGVVAHELAHVRLKHGIRMIVSAAGPYLVFKMFSRDGEGLFGVLGDGSQLLVRQSFSQSFELEADATGWDMLVRAHIDPRGLTDMLRRLKAIEDTSQGEPAEPEAFRSHPATGKRIQKLEDKWERLQNKTGFIDYNQPPAPQF